VVVVGAAVAAVAARAPLAVAVAKVVALLAAPTPLQNLLPTTVVRQKLVDPHLPRLPLP